LAAKPNLNNRQQQDDEIENLKIMKKDLQIQILNCKLQTMSADTGSFREELASLKQQLSGIGVVYKPTRVSSDNVVSAGPAKDMAPLCRKVATSNEFVVELEKTDSNGKLGLDVDIANGTKLIVTSVREGMATAYNLRAAAERQVRAGDCVVAVNGVREDVAAMIAKTKECKKLTLVVQRPRPQASCRRKIPRQILRKTEHAKSRPCGANSDSESELSVASDVTRLSYESEEEDQINTNSKRPCPCTPPSCRSSDSNAIEMSLKRSPVLERRLQLSRRKRKMEKTASQRPAKRRSSLGGA
jgi:hypothetical protein